MSSYSYGDAAPMPILGITGIGATAIAGTVVLGAVAVAAVAGGAAYSLLKAGEAIYNETERAKKESEQRELAEKARLEVRIKSNKNEHGKLIEDCTHCQRKMRGFLDRLAALPQEYQSAALAQRLESYIADIETLMTRVFPETAVDQTLALSGAHEMLHGLFQQSLHDFDKALEQLCKRQQAKGDFAQTQQFVEELQSMNRQVRTVLQVVQAMSDEQVMLKRLEEQRTELSAQVYYAISCEALRAERMPINREDEIALKHLLDNMRSLAQFNDTAKKQATRLSMLKDELKQYHGFAAKLDAEEKDFRIKYLAYRTACDFCGESAQSASSFFSAKQLDAQLVQYEKKVVTLQQRQQEFSALGKNHYIKKAFDTLLQEYGYAVLNEKMQGPVEIIDFSMGADNVLQMIIKEDMGITMETFATADKRNFSPEEIAQIVKQQTMHCTHQQEIRRRLKEDFFIDWNRTECVGPKFVRPKREEINFKNSSYQKPFGKKEKQQPAEHIKMEWGKEQ